jgi:hypothetical protein
MRLTHPCLYAKLAEEAHLYVKLLVLQEAATDVKALSDKLHEHHLRGEYSM